MEGTQANPSGRVSSEPMQLLVNEKVHLQKEVEHLMQQVAELTEQNDYFKIVACTSETMTSLGERPLAEEISQSLGVQLIPHGTHSHKVCTSSSCFIRKYIRHNMW